MNLALIVLCDCEHMHINAEYQASHCTLTREPLVANHALALASQPGHRYFRSGTVSILSFSLAVSAATAKGMKLISYALVARLRSRLPLCVAPHLLLAYANRRCGGSAAYAVALIVAALVLLAARVSYGSSPAFAAPAATSALARKPEPTQVQPSM
jgi:hypothetical protein